MRERRMPQIMRERHSLRQILIHHQGACQRAGDLRHFQRMGQARTVVIPLVIDEHLRFVFQAAKRAGMDHAVAVALERRTVLAFRFLMQAPQTHIRAAGIRCQRQGAVIIGGLVGCGLRGTGSGHVFKVS